MGVLALGAAPANAPGSLQGPGGESFGTSLSNALTSVVERDRPPATGHRSNASRTDTAVFVQALRRTLTP